MDYSNKIGRELGILYFNRKNEPIDESKLRAYLDRIVETFPMLIGGNEVPIDNLILYATVSPALRSLLRGQWAWARQTLAYYDINSTKIEKLQKIINNP